MKKYRNRHKYYCAQTVPALYSFITFYLAQNGHNVATAPKQVIDNAYILRISRRNGIVEVVGSIPPNSSGIFNVLAVFN